MGGGGGGRGEGVSGGRGCSELEGNLEKRGEGETWEPGCGGVGTRVWRGGNWWGWGRDGNQGTEWLGIRVKRWAGKGSWRDGK